MLQRLSSTLSDVGQNVSRELSYSWQRANEQWADIKVQCPSCAATLKPPADTRVFACSNCGVSIARPGVNSRASYHTLKVVNSVGNSINDALGVQRPVSVIMPSAVSAGQTVRVSTGATLVDVTVPRDMQQGESLVVRVPASAVPDAPLRASQAPNETPVAEEAVSTVPAHVRRHLAEENPPQAQSDNPGQAGASGLLTDATIDVLRGLQSVEKGIRAAWNDVKVRCPSCWKILEVPDGANVKVFACSGCGATLNKPDTPNRLDYHLMNMGKQVGNVVDAIVGATKPLQVQVPLGVRAGDPIQVPGADGHLFTVVVPEGIEPGQTFTAQVPARSVADHVAIVAEQAPAVVPVAEHVMIPASSEMDTAVVDRAAPRARATPSIAMSASSSAAQSDVCKEDH